MNVLQDVLFQKRINISFTTLSTFERCPRRKLLELAIPRDEWRLKQPQRNFVAGSVAHEYFAEWVSSGFSERFLDRVVFEDYFNAHVASLISKGYDLGWKDLSPSVKAKWGVGTDREYALVKGWRAVETMFLIARSLKFAEHGILSERWIRLQHPSDERFGFVGAVDIYDVVDDIIYDLKVTENAKYGNPMQLAFYAMLLGAELGRLPQRAAFLYPLVVDKVRVVDFVPHLDAVVAATDDFILAFDLMRFPAIPSRDCGICPVRAWCSAKGGFFEYEEFLNE